MSSDSRMLAEKRRVEDRRSRPTRFLSRYTLKGRRRKARRQNEAVNYYVDRYELRYLILIGLIMILCFLDYFFSFKLLRLGGIEINLLMSNLLKNKGILLLFVKLGLTFFGLVFILFHKNFKVFGVLKTRAVIYYVFSLYLALILYEFYAYLALSKTASLP
jgi:hypothetical protein